MWPSLQSVLRGGIAFNLGLPVASGGTADRWMLSLEPLSSLNAGLTSCRPRLAVEGAYALPLTAVCLCGS
jgi:hypothetical protein